MLKLLITRAFGSLLQSNLSEVNVDLTLEISMRLHYVKRVQLTLQPCRPLVEGRTLPFRLIMRTGQGMPPWWLDYQESYGVLLQLSNLQVVLLRSSAVRVKSLNTRKSILAYAQLRCMTLHLRLRLFHRLYAMNLILKPNRIQQLLFEL